MSAAVALQGTFSTEQMLANLPTPKRGIECNASRFEPVSKLLVRCEAKSLEIASLNPRRSRLAIACAGT